MGHIFEIIIQPETQAGWPVKVREEAAGALLDMEQAGLLQLDLIDLRSQVEPTTYGTVLGMALFREQVRDAFVGALARSDSKLHLLLTIEDAALRAARWEWLCAPQGGGWKLIALEQKLPSSFYLPSLSDHPFPAIERADLRALILVANPAGLAEFGLSPFDAAASLSSLQSALGDIPHTTLAGLPGAAGRPTLDQLCQHLTAEPYPILHIVAHGHLPRGADEPVLYLTTADNQVAPLPASKFLARLGTIRNLPHFIFLATCESASPAAEGTLGGLAHRLVRELGIPAVLAMTERVTIATAGALAGQFYAHLKAHGEVDLARVEACAGLAARYDVTVPALYSRLRGQPLFQGLAAGAKPRLPYEPEIVLIPAGPFLMGADDDQTGRQTRSPYEVTLPAYRIGQYPVTNRQYAEFIRQTGRVVEPALRWEGNQPPKDKLDRPVSGVTWYEALAYCRWLAGQTGRPYTLPSEAQWEKAARGEAGRRYVWGERREWTSTLWGRGRDEPDPAYADPWRGDDGRDDLTAPGHIRRVYRSGPAGERGGYLPGKPGPRRNRHSFRVAQNL